jgi:hypothetical protein
VLGAGRVLHGAAGRRPVEMNSERRPSCVER